MIKNRSFKREVYFPFFYDQTDINKIASGVIKNGIIGGIGAIMGITTGSGNSAIDAATGGLTGLTISSPTLKKKTNTKATPAQAGDKK